MRKLFLLLIVALPGAALAETNDAFEIGLTYMTREAGKSAPLLRGTGAFSGTLLTSNGLGAMAGGGLYVNFKNSTHNRNTLTRFQFMAPSSDWKISSGYGGVGLSETHGSSFGLFSPGNTVFAQSQRKSTLGTFDYNFFFERDRYKDVFWGLRAMSLGDSLSHKFTNPNYPDVTSKSDLKAKSLLLGPQIGLQKSHKFAASGIKMTVSGAMGYGMNWSKFDASLSSEYFGVNFAENTNASHGSGYGDLAIEFSKQLKRGEISVGYRALFVHKVASAPLSSANSNLSSNSTIPRLVFDDALFHGLTFGYEVAF